MEADGERFDLGVLWSRDFERLGDAQMQQLAARGEEATRHDFPNPVVSEVEALAPTLKESAAHQLLDASRGFICAETRGPLEEIEVELAADDRRHRGKEPRRLGQPFEPSGHDLADALREREA